MQLPWDGPTHRALWQARYCNVDGRMLPRRAASRFHVPAQNCPRPMSSTCPDSTCLLQFYQRMSNDEIDADFLWSRLEPKLQHLSDPDKWAVHSALNLAYDAHNGQVRKSGEPFITHPLEVTRILAELVSERVRSSFFPDISRDDSTYVNKPCHQRVLHAGELSTGLHSLSQSACTSGLHSLLQSACTTPARYAGYSVVGTAFTCNGAALTPSRHK